ncbi:MAG: hypothetical protein HDT14_13090 [Oscillibacter sp.]|nr:hypothetical protein [Oscillibacter sp.]
MNGIEKITARIETDAKAEAAAILREAEEKAAAIREQYKVQAAAQARAAEAEGREAAKRQAERLESAAQMDAKKQLLAVKQACLNEAFDKAQKELLALPDGEYAQLLARMAVKASRTGKEEILLNARDLKRVGAQVVEKANALKKGAALTLSGETREMAGGLTLRDGNVEVNCAFETQLRVLREEMAAQVAGILFS